jgi:antitoxin component of RelBE/YafQ-DinJ toxin-antitoxin module
MGLQFYFMANNEVLSIRVDHDLGAQLTSNAESVGLTRADYLRMILRAASTIDPAKLKQKWDNDTRKMIEGSGI